MTTLTSDNLTDQIRSITEEVIEDPLYVVDIVVRGQKGSRVIEVFIDSDEVLTLKQIADANREIGFLLESEDVVAGRYHLNVSSPGIDRPLAMPRQFRKNIGRDVTVTLAAGEHATVDGKLLDADEAGFVLERTNNEHNRFSYGDVKEVRVLLPW